MTKTDLSDEITMEIIEEDIRELTDQVGYSDVTIERVSSKTGDGIDRLSGTLQLLTSKINRSESNGSFRMPIDRSFSVPGRGCVVAGTIWQGRVASGDQMQILPSGTAVRDSSKSGGGFAY
jgi:selenocysteine-specific elongation factor